MKPYRTLMKSRNYKGLLSMFVLGLLLSNWVSVSQATEELAPGLPPTWPERPITTQGTGDIQVFLPLVLRPPAPPPWVDTQNRASSQLLYMQEYLGSASTDPDWTGDHDSCSAGETSDEFRSAILRRINYYRSMAGIPALTGLERLTISKPRQLP